MKQQTRDNLIYISVGLIAVIAVAAPLVYYDSQDKEIPDFPTAPVWVVLSGAIVFGYTVREYKRYVRLPRFWVLLILLLGCHVIGWIVFARSVERLPLLLMGVSLWPEGFVVYLIMEMFVRRKSRRLAR